MIPPFRRTQTTDPAIRQLQDATERTVNSIAGRRIVDGVLIEDIELSSGDNTIEHKLGRILRGYIVVRRSAACDVYDKQDTNDLDDKTLILNSSAAATVALWVF